METILILMLIYELYKFVSPEWEMAQRNQMYAMSQNKEKSIVWTKDLATYTVLQLLYKFGELIMICSLKPKYMVASIAIQILSKVINSEGEMTQTLIRVDSLATIGILTLAILI